MLNSEQMLPARVRQMRQMGELLDAEDLVLAEIEHMIEEMYGRAAMLHEELVNEGWLEAHLEALTGAETSVAGYAEMLLVKIMLDAGDVDYIDLQRVRDFLNKWLPAHLMYKLAYLLAYAVRSSEEFRMDALVVAMTSLFWDMRTLDGTWLLDGTYFLDAVRKPERYGIGYAFFVTGGQEDWHGRVTLMKDLWVLDGTEYLDGSRILDAEIREEVL